MRFRANRKEILTLTDSSARKLKIKNIKKYKKNEIAKHPTDARNDRERSKNTGGGCVIHPPLHRL
jgi:hypothetical protein